MNILFIYFYYILCLAQKKTKRKEKKSRISARKHGLTFIIVICISRLLPTLSGLFQLWCISYKYRWLISHLGKAIAIQRRMLGLITTTCRNHYIVSALQSNRFLEYRSTGIDIRRVVDRLIPSAKLEEWAINLCSQVILIFWSSITMSTLKLSQNTHCADYSLSCDWFTNLYPKNLQNRKPLDKMAYQALQANNQVIVKIPRSCNRLSFQV